MPDEKFDEYIVTQGKCHSCIQKMWREKNHGMPITNNLGFDFVNGNDPIADLDSPAYNFGRGISHVYGGPLDYEL